MWVEIPDTGVILNVVLAFLVGVGVLYGYYNVRSHIKPRGESGDPQNERLEYYETQLIDMKIRLDALEIQGIEPKTEDPNLELKRFLERLARNEVPVEISQPETVPERQVKGQDVPVIGSANPTSCVLQLVTNKAMTSRDIQVTLKRSREHTSRLMKKLFEEGLVERNVDAKPYTYSITEKGRTQAGETPISPASA